MKIKYLMIILFISSITITYPIINNKSIHIKSLEITTNFIIDHIKDNFKNISIINVKFYEDYYYSTIELIKNNETIILLIHSIVYLEVLEAKRCYRLLKNPFFKSMSPSPDQDQEFINEIKKLISDFNEYDLIIKLSVSKKEKDNDNVELLSSINSLKLKQTLENKINKKYKIKIEYN